MRVALDVTPLGGQQTGIGLFVEELVRGLAANNEITLHGLAMTARGRDAISQQLPSGTKLSRPAPARLLRRAWRFGPIPPVEWLTGSVDLVHGTNYVVPPTRRAARLVSIHDLTPWHSPTLVHPSSLDYPPLVQRALEQGAHVHTGSDFVAQEIRATLPVEASRVHVVPYGIRPQKPGNSKAGQRLVGKRPYLLAIGTIEPRKNFASLVGALASLSSHHPELVLAIAGGSGWDRRALDQAISSGGLENRVIELGYVTQSDKSDLMAGAELLVSAATYEGFGLVPLEAMAAGLPVVAVAGGSIPEVCGEAAMLVPTGEASTLAHSINRALTDEAWRKDAVVKGKAQAATFSWNRNVRELSELYFALASR